MIPDREPDSIIMPREIDVKWPALVDCPRCERVFLRMVSESEAFAIVGRGVEICHECIYQPRGLDAEARPDPSA